MSLALLIYLANVLPNVASLLIMLGLVIVVIQVLFTLFHTVNFADSGDETRKNEEAIKRNKSMVKGVFAIPMFLLAILIPSEKTIYLMAAASVGQQAVEELSPELTKMRTIINEKLDGMLEEVQQ